RMLEADVKRNEAAQRGTADAGILRAGEGAVFLVDEGLHFFDHKFCVTVGAAPAEFGNVSRSVFENARLGVVNADDDQWSDYAGLNSIISGLADVPVLAGDEGSGAVEKILAVLKIENRETGSRLVIVARW